MQSTNNIAFKEWAVVCAALGAGRQTIILRKGGIDEGRDGFRVQHNEFWLLPTRFHQEPSQLTPDAQPLWRQVEAESPPAGKFRINLYAVVHDVLEFADLAKIHRLAGEHILSAATVEQRFHYRRPGLFVLVVRVYRVPAAFEIDDSPYIAGCKSWVELPAGHSTTGAQAVLDAGEFTRRSQAIFAGQVWTESSQINARFWKRLPTIGQLADASVRLVVRKHHIC